jgi:SAM-dependent methyltransferase
MEEIEEERIMAELVTEKAADELREKVRERYGNVAKKSSSGGCCGSAGKEVAISQAVGYSPSELGAIPAEANLGVGCGNPTAFAEIRPGDTVLDLGSGAGIDCFLAANAAGAEGHVIGVDMTDEMLERARTNAERGGYTNVEFRKGMIEDLPVEDASVDVVISNCVINLSPDKARVFSEIFRVLKPGGRMLVSDIVLAEPLPEAVSSSIEAYVGCVAGAMLAEDYLALAKKSGFATVEEISRASYGDVISSDDEAVCCLSGDTGASASDVRRWASSVLSVKVKAIRA